MKSAWRILIGVIAVFAVGLALLGTDRGKPPAGGRSAWSTAGESERGADVAEFYVSEPVMPTVSAAVRDLPDYEPEYWLDREINPRLTLDVDVEYVGGILGGVDPLLALQQRTPRAAQDNGFLTPIFNLEGQGYTGVNPPDTEGDVGQNHYVQVINGSGGGVFTIHDKIDASVVAGPKAIDSLGSGACAIGLGDGIVLYDQLADRWMLSEFSASGNHLCVYVSVTPDPAGTWYAYDFATPNFPDYPKYAVWPDAYYVTTNESSGPAAYALDRQRMLQGLSANYQRFAAPRLSGFGFQALTPSDVDGPTPPPAGAPNFMVRHRDDEVHNAGANNPSQDFLEVWQFHVDFQEPSNSSFTGPTNVAMAEIDSDLCGLTSFYCFPQPGSTTTLDPLREVVMWRLVYRNFGTHQTLVGNLVTDVDGTNHGGIRWFELRKPTAGSWGLFQQGTFAPDAHSRWMGSIAMDGEGNIALGYSVTSSSLFPSVRYVGRTASDPLGVMTYGEASVVQGSAANSSNRWGDYSSMHVDPADDCTFWFTNMYSPSSHWSTRIAVFRFDGCGSPDFSLTVEPTETTACSPQDAVFQIEVYPAAYHPDPVDLTVTGVPAGATASFSPNPVTPRDTSVLTIGDTADAAPGLYDLQIAGTGPLTVHTAAARLHLTSGVPAETTLLKPADGEQQVRLAPVLFWNAAAGATSYQLQVAADPSFDTLVESASGVVKRNYVLQSALDNDRVYYWRVRAVNACGVGQYSYVYYFRTMTVSCAIIASDDVHKPIPASGTKGTMTSQLMVPTGGLIVDLNVLNLAGTHTWINDLSFSLDSPAGTHVQLMNRSCVREDNFSLNLDDEAPPGSWPCPPVGGGTYRPSGMLSSFDGQNGVGVWTLTIDDAATGDRGQLDSWSLEVCTQVFAAQAGLSIDITAQPASVLVGDHVTYTLAVTNQGPETSTGTTVVDPLPPGISLISAAASQGACRSAYGSVTCDLGGLASGGSASVTLVAATGQEGPVQNTGFVGAFEADPEPADNSATEILQVSARQSDLLLSKEDSADLVWTAERFTYTLTVQNGGPQDATGVVMVDLLPAGVAFVSAQPSQGSCAYGQGRVECVLGTVGVNESAVSQVVVTAVGEGLLLNTAIVTAQEFDAIPANNSATETTSVAATGPGYRVWLPVLFR